VHDLVNRGPDFDGLYVYRPILGACCGVIGRPFKLSAMLARTVNPNVPAQSLHADFRRDAEAGVNQAARIRQETLARIGPLAKYLLAL
jgi:hypothetical protein